MNPQHQDSGPPCGDSSTRDAPLAEQLRELSALTGGLAHEIRNPLSTLKVNLQLLDEDWRQVESSDPAGHPEAQDIARRSRTRITTLLKEADRLEQILHDFLQYIGRRDLKCTRTDLNHVVSELADFYRPQAHIGGIELTLRVHDRPLLCDVDVNLLKQALLNLLINAQQAMQHGGHLRLTLSKDDAGFARIDVTDSGSGIPAESRERIFQAYYSTKKGGTGLGLATARRIIREHGGTISVQSEPAGGATFTIRLPMHDPGAA